MGKFLKLAWRNAWRNWRRTSIAVVAIVLGLVLLLFFDGFIKGSDQAIFGNAVRLYGGNVQAHAPGFREKASRLPLLPLESADAVVEAATAEPQVLAAAKRINTGGIVSSREGAFPVVITGIEPGVEAPLSIQAENVTQGRFLLDDDGDAILIGQGLADLLRVSAGDRIVGVYDLGMAEAEKGAVFITLPEAQSLYNLRDGVTEVAISLESVGQEEPVVSALQAALPSYEIDSWDTLRPEMRQTLATKLAFTSVFGLVVVFIASIGILNIQLMAVFERTREMGVLAAVGMKGRQIMNVFLLEGTLIGAVGAVIGCLLSAILLGVLGDVGIDFSFASEMGEMTALLGDRIYPSVTAADIISRGITVTLIVAIASLYPAWQASRKEPAEALHHV
jgi:ABC-type lipoprotein release transport system permease subunit